MNAVKQVPRGGDRLIRVSMTVVVLAVAAVAAWVSYWHAVAVIEKYGAEDEVSAHLVPATVDGMIYASSMVLLWCARYRLPVPSLARWALALGVAATLAANILHGIERGPLAAALAAWPAIALVISYELIMWVVRSGREIADRAYDAGQPERAPAPVTVLSDQAPRVPQTGQVVDATPQIDPGEPTQETGERRSAPAEPEPAATRAGQDASAGETRADSDRRAQVAALLAQDPHMTGAALARTLGVHETTGRKYRREALNGHGRSA
ncbi:DUF2637 domain-containing protein [Nonomuraea aurantiaca]|uniref:DUF2637 domain-containing protein n=1 Tax=Nonomuraea aurantiaca TaxID=2878562 RepID=UPI001CD93DC5|nr:DUF2637 domain-containing protein [Nonomuraea aurantiaca]MCA2220767.1 DUF2637 domain-containing protein [Nonomuraea aurantiaca]